MKLVIKKHQAKVIQLEDGTTDVELQDPGEILEDLGDQQMQEHYRVEVVAQTVGRDNDKYRKLAISGAKPGDSVQVLQKYLVD